MPCWCSLQKQHLRLLWEQWELKGSPYITWNHIFRFVVIIISTNRALSSTYLCLLNGHDDPKKGRGERWSCLRLRGYQKFWAHDSTLILYFVFDHLWVFSCTITCNYLLVYSQLFLFLMSYSCRSIAWGSNLARSRLKALRKVFILNLYFFFIFHIGGNGRWYWW